MIERDRMLALVTTPTDPPRSQTIAALCAVAQRAVLGCPAPDPQWRVSVAVPHSGGQPASGYDAILERGLANGVRLGGFTAVIELSAADRSELLAPCFGELRSLGDEHIDIARSTVVVGHDLVIVDGDGDTQLVYAMARERHATHESFLTYWAEEHTKVARSTPGLSGYRQLHVDLTLSHRACDAAGLPYAELDGVALEWFDALDDFVGAVGGPAKFRDEAKTSEQRFNDLDRARAIVATAVASSRGLRRAQW